MNKIDIYSPIDKSFIGSVPAMTKEQIEDMVKDLKEAYVSFSELSIKERAEILRNVAKKIEENKEKISLILSKEISKSYKDCVSEVERSIEMLYYTIEEAFRIQGELVDGDSYGSKDKYAIVRREPLGIILCIAPFNYPINLSLSKIVPALITGNVVLFKPPTQGSYVCTQLVELMNEVLPKNVLRIVTGRGRDIGDYINTLEDVAFINFTGSTEVGKKIAKQAGMKPLMMELGGKDAAIVLEDADLEKASSEIVKGAFSYSGQRCTAIKRVLVCESVADSLVDKIKEKVLKLKIGNPLDNVDISPLIDKKSADFVMSLIEDAKDKGAKVLVGDKQEDNLVYPTLLDEVDLTMKVAFEEPFGPVLPIIRVKDVEEAIKIANMSEYGLQSSVFTSSIKEAFYVAKKLEVGTVQINNKTQRGPDNFPFMGIKNSGIGVQGIKYSLLAMTKLKSIVIDM